MQDLIAFGIFELTALMQSGFALAINATCSLEATSQYERQGRGPLLSFSRKAQTTHLFVVHGLCPHSRAPVFSRRLYLNDICAPLLACFFFFVYFSAYSLSVSLSPQPAALPIEAPSILAVVLFVSTQEEEEAKKKKKTIGDARLLAVSPQACSLFTGCTKFARIYIDAT